MTNTDLLPDQYYLDDRIAFTRIIRKTNLPNPDKLPEFEQLEGVVQKVLGRSYEVAVYAPHYARGVYHVNHDQMLLIRRSMIRDVQQHARAAIRDRLGQPAGHALISVKIVNDGSGDVIVHVNSGGNAIACRHRLRANGYTVTDTDYDPFADGHYGVQIRVRYRTDFS